MRTVSAERMRELDACTINSGTPGTILMERAGAGAVEHILEFCSRMHQEHVKRFVLLAGKGNNGGDAYVCARYLRELTNADIVIYSICDISDLSGDALLNAGRLPDGVVCITKDTLSLSDFKRGDIIIDGLLGTGFSGVLRPGLRQWIDCVNSCSLPVIALDIPSGLNGTDGVAIDSVIRADLCITIGAPKSGLYLGSGPDCSGLLRLVDIGICQYTEQVDSDFVNMPFYEEIAARLGRIPCASHKNSRGRLTVLGGSEQYRGAPLLSARAAVCCGAGYVKLALPESILDHVRVPASLVVLPFPIQEKAGFGEEFEHELSKLFDGCEAMVFGPGMGRGRSVVPIITQGCKLRIPIVLDADALNVIAEIPEIFTGKDTTVLTPHPGEMRRLLEGFDLYDALNYDRISQARALAETMDSTVVLKGNRSVICSPDGRVSVNSSGSPALSKAGTGDCLAGMIGAFLAQQMDPFEAAETAVFIHGMAAELAPCAMRSLTPEILIDSISDCLKRISPFA